MADGIDVDPASMRHCAEQLTVIARDVSDQWQTLVAQSEAFGDIFGDDDVGGLIKLSYQAALGVADECMASVAEAMAGFGEGLDMMATEYQLVEEDNENLFRRS